MTKLAAHNPTHFLFAGLLPLSVLGQRGFHCDYVHDAAAGQSAEKNDRQARETGEHVHFRGERGVRAIFSGTKLAPLFRETNSYRNTTGW